MSYVDLVLCETSTGRTELFQAPKFSLLKPYDEVTVDIGKGQESILKVKDVINISTQSDEYRFITELFGVPEPRKLAGKISHQRFDYEAGDDDG
jgi:hypothetical protein